MFLLFAYDQYYPAGGMNDLMGVFDTFDEAHEKAMSITYDWKEIVDWSTREAVWTG